MKKTQKKRQVLWLGLLCLSLVFTGCNLTSNMKGDYLLYTKKYSEGIAEFEKTVQVNPDDAAAKYYLGRFLLAQKKSQPQDALRRFSAAVKLQPENATYLFWQGVAFRAVDKPVEERAAYLQVLSHNKHHLRALTYLGHNQLEAGELDAALVSYNKVLKLWKYSPAAMFNKALIFRKQKEHKKESAAWLAYLDAYSSGAMTLRAANFLNSTGDFQYRNQTIGSRVVTIEKIVFRPGTAELILKSHPSINLISSVYSKMKNSELHILSFYAGNKELARLRAAAVKKNIVKDNPAIRPQKIRLSWFAEAEEILTIGGKKYNEDESIAFFVKKL